MDIDKIREDYLLQKGAEVRTIAMVKQMLKENEPIEKIIKYTRLSEEEILSIKKQI